MASKTPKRAQEIRDLARALCIRAWLDTNWNEEMIYINGDSVPVGDTVERLWLAFPTQGTALNIRYVSTLKPVDPKNPAWYRGESLVSYNRPPGDRRFEQIWWKMVAEQKSFAGMGLLGESVMIVAKPSEEAEAWAEEIFAPYGIPLTAGVYQVFLRATAVALKSFTGHFLSEEEARAAALRDNYHSWTATQLENPEITEVKKTA